MSDAGRSFETTIEIDAPPEAVWKALTDAEELTHWFPLEARVTPGVGGSLWISWGSGWDSEMRIEIWEPNRRLRAVSLPRPAFDAEGGHVATTEPPAPLAVDYYIEGHSGKTVLRLVHSGFGRGPSWDDEYDSIRKGWKFELRGLRHYLERHLGHARAVAWARKTTDLGVDEAWARLLGAGSLVVEGKLDGLKEGDCYGFRAATGDIFEGVVQQCTPPWDFSGTVRGLNDALLRIATERFTGKTSVNVWLSTYGLDENSVQAFQGRMQQLLDRTFAAAA
jgi:uncharacterized protein YndB with AHSA1/START domain